MCYKMGIYDVEKETKLKQRRIMNNERRNDDIFKIGIQIEKNR